MMEMDLQGWLTSVLASWGLVSVASVLTHGVMLVLLVGVAFLADAVCRCFLLKAGSFGEAYQGYVGRCGIRP